MCRQARQAAKQCRAGLGEQSMMMMRCNGSGPVAHRRRRVCQTPAILCLLSSLAFSHTKSTVYTFPRRQDFKSHYILDIDIHR